VLLHFTAKQQSKFSQNFYSSYQHESPLPQTFVLVWLGVSLGCRCVHFPTRSVGFVIDWTGTHQECQYGLMSFGIHLGTFPIDTNGMLKQSVLSKYEVFSKFVVHQRIREQEARVNHVVSDTIESATNNDVLFGKNKMEENNTCDEWL
jgi:hypothetical protein